MVESKFGDRAGNKGRGRIKERKKESAYRDNQINIKSHGEERKQTKSITRKRKEKQKRKESRIFLVCDPPYAEGRTVLWALGGSIIRID